MDKAPFAWSAVQYVTLAGIQLNVTLGTLVGIVGPTGAGKSSLITAILGEMALVNGASRIHGQLAYVSQTL